MTASKPKPDDELVFVPLGGAEEIGMNLNAYGYGPPDNRKWIVVDIGVTFGGTQHPGVELILPDPTFLENEAHNLLGIVLTHAHEDHIGALGYLWPRLRAPVYATPFTAALVREKLKERRLETKALITETPLKGRLRLGPFDIEYITLTHSIPEPNGLAIRTPLGLIWHTGDWKIDPDPLIGETTDVSALARLAEEGVLAMVCDSTNVFVDGVSGSEADVRAQLEATIRPLRGRVAVTAFASNVARVESIAAAAHACGRSVCLVGRSMHRVVGAAKGVGLLGEAAPFVSESDAAGLSRENVLYLCTGSQGEARAALTRIANGDYRGVRLDAGDTVLFSSRVIPGNEVPIYALYNQFSARGITVITDRDAPIHVSGHPCREELRQMYQWARPRISVPVHGERRHILEHAAFARSLQTPEAVTPRNGDIIRLAPGPAAVIDEAPAGRLFVDGDAILPEADEALRDRRRLAAEGVVTVAMAIGGKRRTISAGPDVRLRGLGLPNEDDEQEALDRLILAAEQAFGKLSASDRSDEELTETAVMRAVRKAAETAFGKRPFVEVSILRI